MRGILLDLDDTLIDDRGATHAAFQALLEAHRLDTSDGDRLLASWRSIAARHWQSYETRKITFSEQRRQRMRDFLGRPLNDEEADDAFRPYLSAYEKSWKLLSGVHEFLDGTRHFPKVIITNGERNQQVRKMEAVGLAEHVVGVVTPSDCGHWKPHPGIFLAGAAMLGVSPAECLMIGDDEVRDIEPARKLGMRCFLVEAGHEERNLARLVANAWQQ